MKIDVVVLENFIIIICGFNISTLKRMLKFTLVLQTEAKYSHHVDNNIKVVCV